MNPRKQFKKYIYLGVFLIFSVSVTDAAAKKPQWVKKRPVDNAYYIGIGISEKSKGNRDYLREAKDNALNELASEISINISSDILDVITIQSGMSESEFRSEIRSSTEANLEDYTLVDTWENKKEYWVYYRLSKSKYEKKKALKLNNAISLSIDLYGKAKEEEFNKNIASSLNYYVQAFYPIHNYFGEPLVTEYKGSKIFLRNEIYASLQSLIGNIDLKIEKNKRSAKVGMPLDKPIMIHTIYSEDNASKIEVSDLPLKISFIRGSGDLLSKVKTDSRGIASVRVAKITSTDKIQIIKSELDLMKFVNQEESTRLIQSILTKIRVPSTNVILNVTGLSLFFESRELNIGKSLNIRTITPKIKKWLTDKGLTFTDDIAEADLTIKFSVESREGNVAYGQYVAYADLEITAINMSTGEEVYNDGLTNVKGIHLNYDKAGLKALENAYKKMSERMLPNFLETVQR